MKLERSLLLIALLWLSSGAFTGQPYKEVQQKKPLLIIKVESEKDNLTTPPEVTIANKQEIERLRGDLTRHLSSMFEVIPVTDKRDCIELGVVIEKLSTLRGVFYIGSTVISIGKGDNDLLVSHNPVVEPTLVKFESAITFQMSSMTLQMMLGK